MSSTANSHSEHALPELFVLGPAKPTFPGWLGRPGALLFDSKGKYCQLPAFKPAVLLLSTKSARQGIVMGRQRASKEGMDLVEKPPRRGTQLWHRARTCLGVKPDDIKQLELCASYCCHPSPIARPRKRGKNF